jgi:predicted nucleic acid-binding protein
MLVVDASAAVELLLGRPAAARVERLVREHDFSLHAPQLLDVEVVSALRRLVAGGDATTARAGEALDDLLDLPIERYGHEVLVPRIWELRGNFSAYDATYLALAEAVTESGAALVTADARLARAAATHGDVPVHLAA